MSSDTDYLQVLEAIERLPFPMGQKLLTDVLTGEYDNDTVSKYRLDRDQHFGCMSGYDDREVKQILSRLQINGLITKAGLPGKPFFKVIRLTQKGKEELRNPTLNNKKMRAKFESDNPTEEEIVLFGAFDFFLKKYNPVQKHAIVSKADKLLCVAGAGSGKTTVLTKRIEFLVQFCGVPREKILAITFTRKARQEMQHRLDDAVQIETFNSFCEGILKRHGDNLYGKPVRVIQYRDRVRLLYHALRKLDLEPEQAIARYFTTRQRKDKNKEQLLRLFMNDVYSILDYYANNDEELRDFSNGDWDSKMVYNICVAIREEMKELGLRDYSDQLKDALELFTKHSRLIPKYDHVLVDEYQDVNAIQKRLLDVLNPKNLFVVGDPRQSIFGWRGSKVSFILDFNEHYKGAKTVVLTKNYRSSQQIVKLMNKAIKPFRMPDIETHNTAEGLVKLHKFRSDSEEKQFVVEKILQSTIPREEIFVLARTNKQLSELSEILEARGINHILRSDETKLVEAGVGEVTLATVHAIKGLEARLVFVICANSQSYPCIASDHPVLELVKREEHDREEEELRLFYVAVSRAKEELHISYSGTNTKFITNEMKKMLGVSHDATLTQSYKTQGASGDLFRRLREWRTNLSRKTGLPAYMILPDASLMHLAEIQPTTMAELFEVKGIGPAKAQKYGEELLTVLKN